MIEQLWTDLKKFETAGHKKELLAIYRKFPITECNNCGNCCYDPPEITYPEFLLILDNFLTWDIGKSEVVKMFKKIYTGKLYSLIYEAKCIFLNDDNLCTIHSVSPYNCKRWGHQDKSKYEQDILDAKKTNDYVNEGYKKDYDIVVKNTKLLDFCENVKIIDGRKRKPNLIEISNAIYSLEQHYTGEYVRKLPLHEFFLYAFFNLRRVTFDVIRQIKKYQAGDNNTIENYISTIDFEKPLEKLLTYFN